MPESIFFLDSLEVSGFGKFEIYGNNLASDTWEMDMKYLVDNWNWVRDIDNFAYLEDYWN